jgi:hypothetical protein
MGFWQLVLIVGLIAWVACVFLRAVAARACQLRMEMLPPEEEDPKAVPFSNDAGVSSSRRGSPMVAQVVSRPQTGGNGRGGPSGNGSGGGKVPLKRPGH